MSKKFIGGKDTNPEIAAISAAITPIPGGSISHDDLAAAAGLDPNSTRFTTVAKRWRKLIERNSAIRIESRDRVFHFLTADEAVRRGKEDMQRIGRATGRLHVRVASIDIAALSEPRKAEHFLLAREAAAMLESARRSAKAIQGPQAVRPGLRLAN